EGRKQRKRDFRSLWIQRINAGAREHGLSYSKLVHGLRLAEIDLDRKILADLAVTEPEIFGAIVAQAKNALDGKPVERQVNVERSKEPEPPKPSSRSKPAARPEAPAEPAGEDDVSEEPTEVEATGAAERRAEELNVDLSSVEGTGADGRILVEDVEDEAEDEGVVHATDAAERKAEELEVDLSNVEGTGQSGRITVGDVEKAAKGDE
ncbi:MAG TPA: 50S ribosomal protein L20, partial [Rubrobacter sp.]|nr:50S ribosomal protein L20 [Rubrobacter sp.]